MKKAVITLLCFAFGIVSFAQQVDFTGTWVLEKDKSKLDEKTATILKSQTIIANQTATEIRISVLTEETGQGAQKRTDLGSGSEKKYSFDGKASSEVRKTAIGSVKVTWKAELKGVQLLLTHTHAFSGGDGDGEVMTYTTETWELSGNGAVLTVKRESSTPNGVFVSEFIYKRVK